MENWENKILADKLNSLQKLPAGYAPNLSSKWEIVEAGLPNGNKRRVIPLLIRWSVAAAILLGAFFIWVNDSQIPTGAALASIQPGRAIPIVIPSQQRTIVQVESKHVLVKEKALHFAKAEDNVKKIALPQQTTITKFTTQPSFEAPDITIERDTNTAVPETGLAATVLVEKVKPTKKKIYQRDFNDGILVMDTGFSLQSRQHFSIQLKPFSRKVDASEQQSVRRLQWKQAL
jgi:hypothetical protein